MGEVIYIEKRPCLMECTACDDDRFSLSDDGRILCWGCGGLISATWAKVTSSSTPTDVPSAAEG